MYITVWILQLHYTCPILKNPRSSQIRIFHLPKKPCSKWNSSTSLEGGVPLPCEENRWVSQTLIPVTSIFGTIANQQHSMIHRFPFATWVRRARVDTAAIVHEISPSRCLDSKDPKIHEILFWKSIVRRCNCFSLFKTHVNFGGYQYVPELWLQVPSVCCLFGVVSLKIKSWNVRMIVCKDGISPILQPIFSASMFLVSM